MGRPSKWGIAGIAMVPALLVTAFASAAGAAGNVDVAQHVTASSARASAASWPQFRYNSSHTGTNTDETTLTTQNVGGLEQVWSTVTPGTYGETDASINNGILYVGTGDGNQYVALSAVTGEYLWSFGSSGGSSALTAPAVSGGIVFVGYGSDLVALHANTGNVLWKYDAGKTIGSSPAVDGGVVYFGSDNGNVYALDAKTGALKWSYKTGGEVEDSPVVVGGDVYVSSDDGDFYAIHDGTKLWSKPYGGASGPYFSSAGYADSTIYVSTDEGDLYALDPSNGSTIWESTDGGPFAIAGDVVYVTWTSVTGGEMSALDASNGQLLWAEGIGFQPSSPVVANGVLYVAGANTVYAFNASTGGSPLWSAPTADSPSSDPVVAGGSVYVGGANGNVDAFGLSVITSSPRRH
jgi:eukaryotic-like serine/threonine-protein kinase